MSVSHLAKPNPSLLSFVRAFLWQLLRTGQVAETEAEHHAAIDVAKRIFSVARDRDHLWRLFGEYRQWTEQGEAAVLSDALRGALATAPEPAQAESATAPTEPVATPAVDSPSAEPASPPTAEAVAAEPVSAPVSDAVEAEPVAPPDAAPSPAPADPVEAREAPGDGQDDVMSTAGDGPDGDDPAASDGASAQVVRGSEPDTESGEDHNG